MITYIHEHCTPIFQSLDLGGIKIFKKNFEKEEDDKIRDPGI